MLHGLLALAVLLTPMAAQSRELSRAERQLLMQGISEANTDLVCLRSTVEYKKTLQDEFSQWTVQGSWCLPLLDRAPLYRVLVTEPTRFFLYVSEASLQLLVTKTVRVGTEKRSPDPLHPHLLLDVGTAIEQTAEDGDWILASLQTPALKASTWIPRAAVGKVFRQREDGSPIEEGRVVDDPQAVLRVFAGAKILQTPGGAPLAQFAESSRQGTRPEDRPIFVAKRVGEAPDGYHQIEYRDGTNRVVGYVSESDIFHPSPISGRVATVGKLGHGSIYVAHAHEVSAGTWLTDVPKGHRAAYVPEGGSFDVMGEIDKQGWLKLRVFADDGFYVSYMSSPQYRRTLGRLLSQGHFFQISEEGDKVFCRRWAIHQNKGDPFRGELYWTSKLGKTRTDNGYDYEMAYPGRLYVYGPFERSRSPKGESVSACGCYDEVSIEPGDADQMTADGTWYFTQQACERALKQQRTE